MGSLDLDQDGFPGTTTTTMFNHNKSTTSRSCLVALLGNHHHQNNNTKSKQTKKRSKSSHRTSFSSNGPTNTTTNNGRTRSTTTTANNNDLLTAFDHNNFDHQSHTLFSVTNTDQTESTISDQHHHHHPKRSSRSKSTTTAKNRLLCRRNKKQYHYDDEYDDDLDRIGNGGGDDDNDDDIDRNRTNNKGRRYRRSTVYCRKLRSDDCSLSQEEEPNEVEEEELPVEWSVPTNQQNNSRREGGGTFPTINDESFDTNVVDELHKRRGIGKALRNCVNVGKRKDKNAVVVNVDDDGDRDGGGGGFDVGMTTDYPFSQQAHHQTTTTFVNDGFGTTSIETDPQCTQLLFRGGEMGNTMDFSVGGNGGGEDPSPSEFHNFQSLPPPPSSQSQGKYNRSSSTTKTRRSTTSTTNSNKTSTRNLSRNGADPMFSKQQQQQHFRSRSTSPSASRHQRSHHNHQHHSRSRRSRHASRGGGGNASIRSNSRGGGGTTRTLSISRYNTDRSLVTTTDVASLKHEEIRLDELVDGLRNLDQSYDPSYNGGYGSDYRTDDDGFAVRSFRKGGGGGASEVVSAVSSLRKSVAELTGTSVGGGYGRSKWSNSGKNSRKSRKEEDVAPPVVNISFVTDGNDDVSDIEDGDNHSRSYGYGKHNRHYRGSSSSSNKNNYHHRGGRRRRTYEDSFDNVIGRDEDDDGYDGVLGVGSLLAAKAREVDERSGTWRLRDESNAARSDLVGDARTRGEEEVDEEVEEGGRRTKRDDYGKLRSSALVDARSTSLMDQDRSDSFFSVPEEPEEREVAKDSEKGTNTNRDKVRQNKKEDEEEVHAEEKSTSYPFGGSGYRKPKLSLSEGGGAFGGIGISETFDFGEDDENDDDDKKFQSDHRVHIQRVMHSDRDNKRGDFANSFTEGYNRQYLHGNETRSDEPHRRKGGSDTDANLNSVDGGGGEGDGDTDQLRSLPRLENVASFEVPPTPSSCTIRRRRKLQSGISIDGSTSVRTTTTQKTGLRSSKYREIAGGAAVKRLSPHELNGGGGSISSAWGDDDPIGKENRHANHGNAQNDSKVVASTSVSSLHPEKRNVLSDANGRQQPASQSTRTTAWTTDTTSWSVGDAGFDNNDWRT